MHDLVQSSQDYLTILQMSNPGKPTGTLEALMGGSTRVYFWVSLTPKFMFYPEEHIFVLILSFSLGEENKQTHNQYGVLKRGKNQYILMIYLNQIFPIFIWSSRNDDKIITSAPFL